MYSAEECAAYVAHWYSGAPLQTIEMYDRNSFDEQCMQTVMFELLRDFVQNPWPEGMKEGSPQLNEWIDFAMRKVMNGIDFGFTADHEDAIKNLAFNYFVEGVEKLQAMPAANGRLFVCQRQENIKRNVH